MLTDKLFTGQRLDGTGLYYYGARYYDPTIGRFISPDTIVPNPANPQSFNRYSYCLNNPLKYVDPSGNIVEINGCDVTIIETYENNPYLLYYLPSDMCNFVTDTIASPLYQGWGNLEILAPTMTQELLNSPVVTKIEITYNESSYTTGNVMYISASKLTDTPDLTSTMGHEAFHQLMDNLGFTQNSLYEEACAFSIGAAIDKALHHKTEFGQWDDLTSSSSDRWVKQYLNKDIWEPYWNNVRPQKTVGNISFPDYCADPVIYPYDPEGGYEKMSNFYKIYYDNIVQK